MPQCKQYYFKSPHEASVATVQVAIKVAKAIYSDDLSQGMEHRNWHGRQPLTLTAATLYITMHLGKRVFVPGLPPRTIDDVADICKVSKGTIEETYYELHSELRHLIPESIKPPMTAEDWAQFPPPDERAARRR
jgi:hypothetical protein